MKALIAILFVAILLFAACGKTEPEIVDNNEDVPVGDSNNEEVVSPPSEPESVDDSTNEILEDSSSIDAQGAEDALDSW